MRKYFINNNLIFNENTILLNITEDYVYNNNYISVLSEDFFGVSLKGSYDFDDCSCGGICSCGCGNQTYDIKFVNNPTFLSDNKDITNISEILSDYLKSLISWFNIYSIITVIFVIILINIITKIVFFFKNSNFNSNNYKLRLLDPVSWGIYFQDAASPSFEGIVDLHNRIMFYLVVILFGVSWVLLSLIINFNKSKNKLVYRHLNHGTLIELIWTVGPALVLVAIAFPSFKLLYLMDEVIDPAMTVKVTGHQWYWEYEYADFLNEENETINFDSYMKNETSLEKGELRMLEVDNPVILPIDTHIRFIITAADVLHDWAVPSLALKVDACPGRLNQASVIIERVGLYYGQCSEICGVLHSSMPIKIEAVDVEKFFTWILEQ